jgi:hypothetical protein
MRNFLWLLLPLLIAGCTAADSTSASSPEASARADLKDFGPAPELANEVWINTDAPLRLADLRGKVVAIDMWTFG